MNKKGAFWFFLLATIVSTALFLYLTFDTMGQIATLTHVDALNDDVIAGKRVWEKYNCNDCHTILGFGGYYAPDMTKAYRRLGPDGIRLAVKNPDKAFASSWRKMPVMGVTDDEVKNLTHFLKWISEIDNNDWPPQDSAQKMSRSALKLAAGVGMNIGPALFNEKGCISCHSLGGTGGRLGPALDDVGNKYDVETLERLIKNPQSVNPEATMPEQSNITEAELDALAHYLATKNRR